MASSINLTERAVSSLMRGEEVDKPIFQILGFKKIAGQGGNDRYRLNISDGTHSHTFAMLATQLNNMIPDGLLDNFCVIRAEKIISNAVSEKRVLIILDLTVLAPGSVVKQKIGNPMAWNEASNGNADGGTGGAPQNRQPPVQNAGRFGDRPTQPANSYAPVPKAPRPSSYSSNLPGPTIPIRDVTPYNNNKLTIKARVTNKGPIKTWSNSRGEGKLFSVDLLDESGEIRMTGFKESVDQYYDVLKMGDVFIIKNFNVKSANKQFSSLNNDYEISFNNETLVIPCTDAEATEIPVQSFEFVDIGMIENMEKDRIVDVIGVCKRRGEIQTFTSKATQKEFTKREIFLVDKTNKEINLTLWGRQAEDFIDDSNPVVAIKGAKVSDFNGKSLSCLASSAMRINPDIQEAHILRGWFDNEGINLESHSVSTSSRGPGAGLQWKLLREVNTLDNAAAHDKGDYYMSKVTIMAIKRENAMYKACAELNCNKKVVDLNNGFFRCEKCDKETSDFKWRTMLNVHFADASDFVWATCFQETAEIVLGKKTEELGPLFQDDQDAFNVLIKEAGFKNYIVKFKSKVETYNNESRLKHVAMDLHQVNCAEYARKLLNEIKECNA